MKRFRIRLLFFMFPIFIFVLITLLVYYIVHLKVDDKFQNISTYECLLMGDSQIQRINNDLLTLNTLNIASSAELFYFSYNKLLKILRNKNHKIKKIILGVSIHSFAPVCNKLFNLNYKEGKYSLERYLYFISTPYDQEFINLEILPWVNIVRGVFIGPDWGGLVESSQSNPSIEVIDKIFRMQYCIAPNIEKKCYSQQKYLYKIDSLCLSNNIDLFVCSLPYHQDYMKRIDKSYFDFFYSTINNLKGAYHINFLSDTTNADWMSDASHLNIEGAAFYSNKINKIINSRDYNFVD